MKKILCVLLAICFVFLLAACGGRPERGNTTGGDTEQTEKDPEGEKDPDGEDGTSNEGETVQLSAQMFDNARVELDGAENIGIIVEEEEDPEMTDPVTERSYIVSFNDDGTFDKITFVFTTTEENGDGTYEVTQEQIEGNPVKLYVTDAFIFLAYAKNIYYTQSEREDPFYNRIYEYNEENFVIERESGKLYPMEAAGSYMVLSDTIIRSTGVADSDFYSLKTEDGVLKITDLMPNKNIFVDGAWEDKFGNIYVQNDTSESRDGNIIYCKQSVTIGDDGYAYVLGNGRYMNEIGGTMTIERYGKDGKKEENWSANTIIETDKSYNDEVSYLVLTGDEIFSFGSGWQGNEYDWYGKRTGVGTYRSVAYHSHYFGVAFLSTDMLIAKTFDGQVWYYELLSEKNVKYNYDGDRLESYANQGMVMESGDLYADESGVFIKIEEVQGTTVYKLEQVTGSDGRPSVEAKLYKEIEYQADVITIQPLN